MKFWKNSYWKRVIRKNGCKLGSGLDALSRKSRLTLEDGVNLGHVVAEGKDLCIGAQTYIRSGTQLIHVASIGRFCSIGSDVILGQERASHPADWLSSHPFQHDGTGLPYDPAEPPAHIGHDVWIGHSAMIMSGVTVGTGAIIATRAMVTKDVPPYAIMGGMPAKVLRYRFEPELIEQLLASRWWDRPLEQLKGLPLKDPQASLAALAQLPASSASYRRMEITRAGVRLL